MRTLVTWQEKSSILLRHGKSAYPDKVKDHDRPLAPRGVRQAGLAGKAIRRFGHDVDLVLCSTAERAQATLAQAAVDAPVRHLPALYGATGTEILKIVEAERGDAATVLVVVVGALAGAGPTARASSTAPSTVSRSGFSGVQSNMTVSA